MSAVLYHFPKGRPAPLSDAVPVGRERHVDVHPGPSGWQVFESDDGGGSCLGSDLAKSAAIQVAVDFVLRWNATLTISNEGWE